MNILKWNHLNVRHLPNDIPQNTVTAAIERAESRYPGATKNVPGDVFVAVATVPEQNLVAGVVGQEKNGQQTLLHNMAMTTRLKDPAHVQNNLGAVLENLAMFMRDQFKTPFKKSA